MQNRPETGTVCRYEGELADWKDKFTASLGESAQAKERAELLG